MVCTKVSHYAPDFTPGRREIVQRICGIQNRPLFDFSLMYLYIYIYVITCNYYFSLQTDFEILSDRQDHSNFLPRVAPNCSR